MTCSVKFILIALTENTYGVSFNLGLFRSKTTHTTQEHVDTQLYKAQSHTQNTKDGYEYADLFIFFHQCGNLSLKACSKLCVSM